MLRSTSNDRSNGPHRQNVMLRKCNQKRGEMTNRKGMDEEEGRGGLRVGSLVD